MVVDGSVGDNLLDGPAGVLEAWKKNGWSVQRPTLEPGNAILAKIDKGLQAGCLSAELKRFLP